MAERSLTEGAVAVPVLPVADLVRSLSFYERLGFVVTALHEEHGYAIVRFGPTEVHLGVQDGVEATASSSGAYLRVADVGAVHAAWTAAGAREIAPPSDEPYGLREFSTEDLDGNLWRVGSPVETDHGVTSELASDLPGGAGTDDTEWLAIVASALPCGGCGLVATELPNLALGAQVREEAFAFGELLRGADDDAMRRRPSAEAWSALEYGVHVRDVLHVFADRIVRTLRQDEPELGWWDHEAAIADGMANESDAEAVADDLGRNASLVSEALRLMGRESDWQRRSYRRGVETFTIELLARYTLHEVVHHRTEAALALKA